MQRLLGLTAWTVWVYLARNRDSAGHTRARNTRIASDKQLSLRQVKHACRRLRDAGLLQTFKWIDKASKSKAKVRIRTVFGDYRNGQITVPKNVVLRVTRLPVHGGKREGAGRTPNGVLFARAKALNAAVADQPHASHVQNDPSALISAVDRSGVSGPIRKPGCGNQDVPDLNQDVPHTLDQDVPHSTPKAVSKSSKTQRESGAVEVATIEDHTTSNYDLNDLRSLDRNDLGQPRSVSSNRREGEQPPLNRSAYQTESSPRTSKPINTAPRENTEEELTLIAWLIKPGGGILPRYFDPEVMRAVKIPSPPLLSPDLNDLDSAWRLIRYFRGAVERLLKQPCMIFAKCRGADLQRSSYYDLLVEGARTLREFDIAPATWIMFSFDAWRETARGAAKKSPPPINWVFSPKRIQERHAWFSRVESSYGNVRRVYSIEHKEFFARCNATHQLAYHVLEKVSKRNGGYVPIDELRENLTAMVQREFRGGYEYWFERAQLSGEVQHAELAEALRDGDFIWA